MNIFYLDEDYKVAAAYQHFDKHVVGMIKETAPMLCTAHRVLEMSIQTPILFWCAEAHLNHPSTQGVRASSTIHK